MSNPEQSLPDIVSRIFDEARANRELYAANPWHDLMVPGLDGPPFSVSYTAASPEMLKYDLIYIDPGNLGDGSGFCLVDDGTIRQYPSFEESARKYSSIEVTDAALAQRLLHLVRAAHSYARQQHD